MQEKIERKRLAILRILRDVGQPLGSQQITEQLTHLGYDISGRTVRFHLLAMDKEGLTEYIGKHGRQITEKGHKEISNARVRDKVGFLSARIDQMICSMDFDLEAATGRVIVNVSLLKEQDLLPACPLMSRVYEKGFSMGSLISLFRPGEKVGEMVIPAGYVGVGTVCSISLNGVLLSQKIPVSSRFGGLLEIQDSKPSRFVAIINYDGTSLDPLEIFIKSGMTDYLGATGNGNGLIGAGFREIPAQTRDRVVDIAAKLEEIGLGGFLIIGVPNGNVSEIPVSEGNIGAIVIGGLNPIAILEEAGFEVHSRALSGLVPYERLFSYVDLEEQALKVIGK
jgi:HTH-type transcriptional regulator, global nitrogen regulator NrpRI